MTFSEYVIKERGMGFYQGSLYQIGLCNSTLEEWFRHMHYEYKTLDSFKEEKNIEMNKNLYIITFILYEGCENENKKNVVAEDIVEAAKIFMSQTSYTNPVIIKVELIAKNILIKDINE